MIIGFDIETTPFEYNETPQLKLWCMNGDYKDRGQNKQTLKRTLKYLWDTLDDIEEDIVIVAHNMRYDYLLSIDSLPFRSYDYINSIIDKPCFAKYGRKLNDKKTVYLWFVDLMNYVSGSLENVAKSFNVSHKMNKDVIFHQGVSQELIDYCYIDALICYEVLNNKIINGIFKPTISGLSFDDIKKRSGWKYFPRPSFIKTLERQSYFGGRTEVNKKYHDKQHKKLIKLDINSMYPFIYRDLKIPTSFYWKLSVVNGDYTDKNPYPILKEIYESNTYTAIIKARVILLNDCLPYREGEKLSFEGNKKELVGVWTIEEFYPAVRDHEVSIVYIASITVYHAIKGLFAPFVDHWYNIKSESSNEKRLYAKLMLNSAYGKFGERERKNVDYREFFSQNEIKKLQKLYYRSFDHTENKIEYKINIMKGIISMSEVSINEAKGASTIIASLITSKARRYLWESMRNFEWLYCDTDSIFLLESENINQLTIGKKLGQWKVEKCKGNLEVCTYQIMGKKDYRCAHGITMKGIPKKDVEGRQIITQQNYETNSWTYPKLSKFRESERRKLKLYQKYDITKERHY